MRYTINVQREAKWPQVGVLETMDSIFRMFRTATIEEMNDTLDYCQRQAARPVLECAQVRPPACSSHALVSASAMSVYLGEGREGSRCRHCAPHGAALWSESSPALQSMHAAADQAASSREALLKVCAAARLANEVVFSLNVFGLSIFMEDMAALWMESWKRWLAWHSDAAASSDPDVESPECAPFCRACALQRPRLHRDRHFCCACLHAGSPTSAPSL